MSIDLAYAMMLADARLDIGLVHHPIDAPDLRFGPATQMRLGVVLPRASPLAAAQELALADLVGHDLILPRASPHQGGMTMPWMCVASTASRLGGSGTPQPRIADRIGAGGPRSGIRIRKFHPPRTAGSLASDCRSPIAQNDLWSLADALAAPGGGTGRPNRSRDVQ